MQSLDRSLNNDFNSSRPAGLHGVPHVQKKLSDYAVEFMKVMSAPEDHDELIRKGEEFIAEWEKKKR